MKDSNQVISAIQLQYFQKYEDQINEKIQNLQQISQMIMMLKDHFNTALENISKTIQQWVTMSMNHLQAKGQDCYSSQVTAKLQKIEKEENQYKKIIQSELETIQQCEILNQCVEHLLQVQKPIDFQIRINLKQYRNEPQRTPKLDIQCKEHSKEIIMFDLNEKQIREKRILCIDCEPCIFTSLSKCQTLWKNYQSKISDLLKQSYLAKEQHIEILSKQLRQVKKLYGEKINFVIQSLNLELVKTQQKISQQLEFMNRDWNEYSLNEVIDIAEILSSPIKVTESLSSIESGYQLKMQHISKVLQITLEELQDIEQQQNKVIDYFLECLDNIEERETNSSNYGKYHSNLNTKPAEPELSIDDSQREQHSRRVSTDSKLKRSQNRVKQLEDSQIKQIKPSDKFIDFQLIYTRKQQEWCNAIAFNKNGTIMVAGCKYDMKVWEFQNGKLTQQYIAKGHTGDVNCLCFSKFQNLFISGSDDKTIRIWVSEGSDWKCIQQLLEHKDWVLCIILNKVENQIISGSRDNTIKVFIRQQNQILFICQQTLTHHTDSVLCVSLNDSETQFVSCSYDKSIIVWKKGNTLEKWEHFQTIKQEDYGNRICYIGDYQIMWQPNSNSKLHLYQLDQDKQYFEETSHNIQQHQANDDYLFFPSLYLKSKDILINVHYSYIYIFKKIKDQEFIVQQIIEFQDYRNFGAFTEDGEYLVTWDYISSEFKVRKNAGTSRIM